MKSMDCMIVFTKTPLPHQVKTRLVGCEYLDADQAAELYEAFLSDVLETVGRFMSRRSFDLIVSYTPREGLDRIIDIVDSLQLPFAVTKFLNQKGQTFDERINDAFSRVFELGYEAAVMVGGDSPTLSEAHLDEAFTLLCDTSDSGKGVIVVGPGIDGGIYLIGLRKGMPFNFEGVFQKSGEVDISLSKLQKKAHRMRIQMVKTSTHYDVDVPEDLESLREELSHNAPLAPHTRQVLRKIKKL